MNNLLFPCPTCQGQLVWMPDGNLQHTHSQPVEAMQLTQLRAPPGTAAPQLGKTEFMAWSIIFTALHTFAIIIVSLNSDVMRKLGCVSNTLRCYWTFLNVSRDLKMTTRTFIKKYIIFGRLGVYSRNSSSCSFSLSVWFKPSLGSSEYFQCILPMYTDAEFQTTSLQITPTTCAIMPSKALHGVK